MKKKEKNIIAIIFILIFIGLVCWGFYEFAKVFEEHNKATQLPAPGTPAREHLDKTWERITRESEQIEKAEELEKEGKYQQAIIEYQKALDIAVGGGYEFMVRESLSTCYEKTSQYELALREVNWLISKQPRKDVLNELLERKARIEKFLQGK